MKKGFFSIVVCIIGCVVFSGCIKNGTGRTLDPYMTANFGIDTFKAAYVQPTTIRNQISDTMTTLTITGTDNSTGNRIVLSVTKFKDSTGTFSIVTGQAGATYFNNGGVANAATSGIVAIKDISANTITGYFSFTTASGVVATNGTFAVGKPWDF